MVVGFSGHRKMSTAHKDLVGSVLRSSLLKNVDKIKFAVVGGAIGFDMLAAKCALAVNIPLVLMLPYPSHYTLWDVEDKIDFLQTIEPSALSIEYVSDEKPTSRGRAVSYLLERNRKIVDISDVLVCYYTANNKSGGTRRTIRHANSKGIRVINLFPKGF